MYKKKKKKNSDRRIVALKITRITRLADLIVTRAIHIIIHVPIMSGKSFLRTQAFRFRYSRAGK